MIRKISLLVCLSVIALLSGFTNADAQTTQTDLPPAPTTGQVVFPEPVGYVNDFAGILTDKQIEELTMLIMKLEQETTDQVAIVTIVSIKPYATIDDYSLDLANYWGVGQKGKNNGIVIALVPELRKIRIQNGYGIESRLTNEETKKIIDEIITPRFGSGNYFEGLKKGLEAISIELKK